MNLSDLKFPKSISFPVRIWYRYFYISLIFVGVIFKLLVQFGIIILPHVDLSIDPTKLIILLYLGAFLIVLPDLFIDFFLKKKFFSNFTKLNGFNYETKGVLEESNPIVSSASKLFVGEKYKDFDRKISNVVSGEINNTLFKLFTLSILKGSIQQGTSHSSDATILQVKNPKLQYSPSKFEVYNSDTSTFFVVDHIILDSRELKELFDSIHN